MQHDASFKHLVDFLRRTMEDCRFTPKDLAQAAVLASQIQAERCGIINVLIMSDRQVIEDEPGNVAPSLLARAHAILQIQCETDTPGHKPKQLLREIEERLGWEPS